MAEKLQVVTVLYVVTARAESLTHDIDSAGRCIVRPFTLSSLCTHGEPSCYALLLGTGPLAVTLMRKIRSYYYLVTNYASPEAMTQGIW